MDRSEQSGDTVGHTTSMIPSDTFAFFLPRRDYPYSPLTVPPRSFDSLDWQNFREHILKKKTNWLLGEEISSKYCFDIVKNVLELLEYKEPPRADSVELEAAMAVMLGVHHENSFSGDSSLASRCVARWIQRGDAAFVLDVIRIASRFQIEGFDYSRNHSTTFSDHNETLCLRCDSQNETSFYPFLSGSLWVHFRIFLFYLKNEEYLPALEKAKQLRAEAPLLFRYILSFFFPEKIEWVEEDLNTFLNDPLLKQSSECNLCLNLFFSSISQVEQAEKLLWVCKKNVFFPLEMMSPLSTFLVTTKTKGVHTLLQLAHEPMLVRGVVDVLFHVPSIQVATAFAQLADSKDTYLSNQVEMYLIQVVEPHQAIIGLLRLLARETKKRPCACRILEAMVSHHPQVVDSIVPQLRSAEKKLLFEYKEAVLGTQEAVLEELPSSLKTLPWCKGKRLFSRGKSVCHPLYDPLLLPRPRLRNGAELPIRAVQTILELMAFTRLDRNRPELQEIESICDERSLSKFVLALFYRWISLGAEGGDWPLHALGRFGGEEAIRELIPKLNTIEVLNQIDNARTLIELLSFMESDISLVALREISEHHQNPRIRARARHRFEQVARQRKLEPQQLFDQIVPTLGFEQSGQRLLKLSTGQCFVELDEKLRPILSNTDLFLELKAHAEWKVMSEELKKIAPVQLRYFESSMCEGRKWSIESFRRYLVEHPILNSLVRRLVWGVYTQEKYLVATFRVDEEKRILNVNGRLLEVPLDGVVGILHPLEIPKHKIRTWSDIIEKLEIVQSFEQLHRKTYLLEQEEAYNNHLVRLEGLVVNSDKVRSLEQRGWRKGVSSVYSKINRYEKLLRTGYRVTMTVSAGIFPDSGLSHKERHKIGTVFIEPHGFWKDIDLILTSEVIRDLYSCRTS